MYAPVNKRHKVSPRLSCKLHHQSWQKILRIKVIKCPLNSSPQGDMHSNPTNFYPKVTNSWLKLRLNGAMLPLSIKIERRSN